MTLGEVITIDRRFCGPPDSANGGYACGLTAGALGDGPAEVTLRRPPPLDRPLRVERGDDGVALLDGAETVATARPAVAPGGGPEPVSFEAAVGAADRFDHHGYGAGHPFPTCYTCGPSSHDGLRIFGASLEDRADLIVWPWRPDAAPLQRDGLVDQAVVWAALDCPSGWAWLRTRSADPAVLGRMRAVVHRRPAPDEALVVAGWPIAAEGRRLHAGSIVWGRDGQVLASNVATWISLTPEQHETFKTAT
jgi:hypothetical protein